MVFHERLNAAMRKRDMRQAELARSAGFTAQRVSLWANGTGLPSGFEMLKLSRALGISLEWLCGDEAAEMEPGVDGLTRDEQSVLELVRALRLSKDEALRALAMAAANGDRGGNDQPAASDRGEVGREVDPRTGTAPVKGRPRRRGAG